MKGHIEIKVTETDEVGAFPIVRSFTIERDNTFESINEWVDAFKSILYAMTFAPETIDGIFNNPDE